MKRRKMAYILLFAAAFCAAIVLAFLPFSGKMTNRSLFDAVEAGDVRSAEAALDKGADINAFEHGSVSSFLGEFVYYNHTPLIKACRAFDMPMVEMLISRGADVNLADPWVNQTPLQWTLSSTALHPDRFALALRLIDLGADVDVGAGMRTPAELAKATLDTDPPETLQDSIALQKRIDEILNP